MTSSVEKPVTSLYIDESTQDLFVERRFVVRKNLGFISRLLVVDQNGRGNPLPPGFAKALYIY